ncbi:MAG TPA: carboxylesterase family protein [Conexibacter sp.]|jgi:para-nitrobenzyl esterase|nr:carboxylesterase family protein [Conexibacter sp.]
MRNQVRVVIALAALMCLPAAAQADASDSSPAVRTDKGVVVGAAQGGVARFIGIPYAAPTGGANRFRAPQPRQPWSTPLQATQQVAPCAQDAYGVRSDNEDCLILNVFAPPRLAGRKPVMVYLHGGGYTAGTSNDFDPTAIVERAGVVVVTVDYRLGAFGFLALPGLDAESPHGTSGNYALLDQQAALRWVQRNIARFGGNPRNVTLFGGSAGAGSIVSQLVSPGAAGLFQRGIVQSLPSTANRTLDEAQNEWLAAIDQANLPAPDGVDLGCPTDVAPSALVACLEAAPAQKLADVGQDVASSGPIVDGYVIPTFQQDAFSTGRFNRVPLILGSNLNEGTFFVSSSIPTQADYLSALEGVVGPAFAPQVAAMYPADAYGGSYTLAYAAVLGDVIITCPTQQVRAALSRHVPVYGYEFRQPDPVLFYETSTLPDMVLGDTHLSELAYVFGVDAEGAPLPAGPDRALSQTVIDYWTGFARTGSPNLPDGSARPHWPSYQDGSNSRLLSLSTPVTTASGAAFNADHHCDVWNAPSE